MTEERRKLRRETKRRWYAKHKEECQKAAREYRSTHLEQVREREARYNAKHREQRRKYLKSYFDERREQKRENDRMYYSTHRKQIQERSRRWAIENPERAREYINRYMRDRNRSDPDFWIINMLRRRLYDIFLGYNAPSTLVLTGCSSGFLKNHLEEHFQPGMSWENRGKAWHIDHIVPLSWFRGLLDDPEWQRVACHWTNLKPMWAKDNISKGNRYAA